MGLAALKLITLGLGIGFVLGKILIDQIGSNIPIRNSLQKKRGRNGLLMDGHAV